MSPQLLYCCLDVSGHFAVHERCFATTSLPNCGEKSDDFHVEHVVVVVFVVLSSVVVVVVVDHPQS